MKNFEHLKPIYRSKLRVKLGKTYYTGKRYVDWYLGRNRFAKSSAESALDYVVFEHKTPLYRQLKNVDMWLQDNKVENLRIAVQHIDGLIVKPGEVFSYWKRIGRPSYRKGYKDGMVLHYGSFKHGVGGGLCQLSNLLYWMVLHSPLTVTERHRHSFDVFPDSKRTQPFGSGATCVYNYRDFQFENVTNEMYQLRIWLDGGYLHGQILSDKQSYLKYEIYEENHEISHQYWGGYVRSNEIRRLVKNVDGLHLHDEHVCTNNALMMYEPLLECSDKVKGETHES